MISQKLKMNVCLEFMVVLFCNIFTASEIAQVNKLLL